MKKNKKKKVKIRTAINHDLFNNMLFRPKTEVDRTKFKRNPKHRHKEH